MEPWLEPLLESPGDPATLRVLSDQLLERGEVWGEAIRLALDLEARWPGEDEFIDGYRRLAWLTDVHRARWQTLLWGPAAKHEWRPDFFRGVPTRVRAFGSNFEKWLQGPVGSVELMGSQKVNDWGRVARVTELNVHDGVPAGFPWKDARAVTRLSLRWDGPRTFEALRDAPFLAQLEALTLVGYDNSPWTAADLGPVLALGLPKLKRLSLDRLALGAEGIAALDAGLPESVRDLVLSNASLGAKGVQALAKSPWLSRLKVLTVAHDTLGEKGAAGLAAAKLDGLSALRLTQSLNVKSAPPLLERAWPELRELGLDACPFKGENAACLTSLTAPKLTTLRLQGAALGDDGLVELAKVKLPKLRVLILGSNSVKGPGLGALGKSKLLSTVESLFLETNKFQNAGAKGLAESKHLGAVRELTLGHNWLGVRGLQGMLEAMPKLERIHEGMNNYANQLERSVIDGEAPSLRTVRLSNDTTTDLMRDAFASAEFAKLEWVSIETFAFNDEAAALLVAGPLAKSQTRFTVYRTYANALTDAGVKTLSVLGDRVAFA